MTTIDLSNDDDASGGAFNPEAHPAYSVLSSRRAPCLKSLPEKRNLLVSLGTALRYETYFSKTTKESHDPGLQAFLASVRGTLHRNMSQKVVAANLVKFHRYCILEKQARLSRRLSEREDGGASSNDEQQLVSKLNQLIAECEAQAMVGQVFQINSERFRRKKLSLQPIRGSIIAPSTAAGYSTNTNAAGVKRGANLDESDDPFGLSDAEQLDIALKASLGLNVCQAEGDILAGACGTVTRTPEKAQRLKTLVHAKVTDEIHELVMKEDSPNGGVTQLDTMFSLQERFRPERLSLDQECEDMVRNDRSADHAYQYFRNKEKYMMKRQKKQEN